MPNNPYLIEQYTTTPCDIALPDDAENAATLYFGFIGPHMVDYATAFAEKHGVQGDFRKAITQFLEFSKDRYLGPEHICACLWVRFTVSGEEWQTPRPHHDGAYWDRSLNKPGEKQFKVGTCFVGPGTLVYDLSKCDDETYAKAQHTVSVEYYEKMKDMNVDPMDIGLRRWAHEKLADMDIETVQVPPNHCLRWVVGDKKDSGIHSEPDQSDMPKGRIFIALLPGTEEQLRCHATRWEESFHTAEGVAQQPGTESKL